ncbi:TIM barrel protein [Paraglaciecola aquimarina]|uniref:TIM barrel protein n=1 Tax=Paraglaciecola algarum TaxID=3050085 RepID=A0ABS9D4R2_9ALTE|nr:TIM barrel protein [Paraglaciecola sp. G1-23]MCF2947900.1 TIM barrel protein [Paraglaciecola sp. G1-23]
MNRRDFVVGTGALVGASAISANVLAKSAATDAAHGNAFQLNYAPHHGHFEHSAGKDIVDQIRFAAEQGFKAWEFNGLPNVPVAEQIRIGKALAKHDMQMGVYVSGMAKNFWSTKPVFSGNDQGARDAFLSLVKSQVEAAKRVNAKWTTVVPGFVDPRMPMGFQTANIIELLHRVCDIFEKHDLTMVLEPLNTRVNHPDIFLTSVDQAYALCTAVNRLQCKILFDIYHEQIQSGNIINTIDAAWDHTAYFQVGDNPGRNEPTTGEINYKNIFAHIHKKGFDGIVGMEHGKSRTGLAGEKALIEAYKKTDPV